jgi:predicted DNA-binding transcriptional regulator YafY
MSNTTEHIKALCDILNKKKLINKLEEIQDQLKAKGYDIKKRQLQHYLKDLRNMGAPIPQMGRKGFTPYNFTEQYKPKLASTLSETEQNGLELVRNLMEQYKDVKEFNELGKAVDKVLGNTNYEPDTFVYPELKPLKKGFKYFILLFNAIKKRQLCELVYFPNYNSKGITYNIEPLMLKESSGMWYCIAKVDNERIRAFSIDRITELTISKKENPNKDNPYPLDIDYTNAFGIVKPENIKKPTKIIIAFEKTLGDMFENRPFHPSQEVIDRNDQEVIMQYQILYKLDDDKRIMRELHREICKYAGSIRIIEPIELKNEICEMLQKGIEMNK